MPRPQCGESNYVADMAQSNLAEKPAPDFLSDYDHSALRIDYALVGDDKALFAAMLMELNVGKSPSDPDWWTPSRLSASIVAAVIRDDAAAHSARAPFHH